MNQTLLSEFFEQDCDLHIRQMLIEEVEQSRGQDVVREFSFNRFNLQITFGKQNVFLTDEFLCGDEGECTVNLTEFERMLKQCD